MPSVNLNDIDFGASASQSSLQPMPKKSTQREVIEEGYKKGVSETGSKDAAFGVRMYLADKKLRELEAEFLASGGQSGYNPANARDRIGLNSFALIDETPIGRLIMTTEGQLYNVAMEDFIQAQLRKETGAQINDSEFTLVERRYLPKIGDSFETIKAKIEARQSLIGTMKTLVGDKLWNEALSEQKASGAIGGGPTESDVIDRIKKSKAFRQRFKKRYPDDYQRMQELGLI